MMEFVWYYAWYSIFFLLVSNFINHKLYKFVIFYNYVNAMWKLHAQWQERENVKTFNEFGNDGMEMYFKHKRKIEGWPYNWRCQNRVEVCFYCVNCAFWQNIFRNKFLICGHAHFIFLYRDLHSFKVLHTKWCSPHYVCVMWKEMIEKN